MRKATGSRTDIDSFHWFHSFHRFASFQTFNTGLRRLRLGLRQFKVQGMEMFAFKTFKRIAPFKMLSTAILIEPWS